MAYRFLNRRSQIELGLLVEDSRKTLAWLVSEMVQAGCAITSLNTQPMKSENVLMELIKSHAGAACPESDRRR